MEVENLSPTLGQARVPIEGGSYEDIENEPLRQLEVGCQKTF